MRVLIVEANSNLGALWRDHLNRQGCEAHLASGEAEAVKSLRFFRPAMVVINLNLSEGEALRIADFTAYQCPSAQVIFVTSSRFFSDGSIFSHAPNACACVPDSIQPHELCAMVEHWGASV